MKDFFQKYREYVLVIAYMIMVAAIFRFGIGYLVGKINAIADSIQERTADQEGEQKRLGKIPKLREQFDFISQEEKKLAVFASKDDAITLIKKIEEIASQTGNEISIVVDEKGSQAIMDNKKKASSKKSKNDAVDEELIASDLPDNPSLRLVLTTVGSFENFFKFLSRLENMEYLSDVIGIKISLVQEEQGKKSTDMFTADGSTQKKDGSEKSFMERGDVSSIVEIIFYLQD